MKNNLMKDNMQPQYQDLTFNNNIEIHEKFGRLYQFQRKLSVSLD